MVGWFEVGLDDGKQRPATRCAIPFTPGDGMPASATDQMVRICGGRWEKSLMALGAPATRSKALNEVEP